MENGFFYFYVVVHILKQILRAWMIITAAVHGSCQLGVHSWNSCSAGQEQLGLLGVAWGLKNKIMSCCCVEGD